MIEIKLIDHENIMGHTHYEIEIKEKGEEWKVNSRFSELREIHNKLKKINKKKNYPHFPPKKLFGNEDPIFIDQRSNALDAYFTTVLKYHKKMRYNLSPWIQFFRENKDTQLSDNLKINSRSQSDIGYLNPLNLNEISDKNRTQILFEDFQDKIISKENYIIVHSKSINNEIISGEINAEMLKDQSKTPDGVDDAFLNDCMDFCNHFNELTIIEQQIPKNLYQQKIIINLKADTDRHK